jgi:MFS family permease
VLWRYLIGAAAARTGDELSGPALLLLGLTVTGTANTAAWLMAGLTVSAAVGGPVFGAMLDRSRYPGRLLAWALAVYALALAVILASAMSPLC